VDRPSAAELLNHPFVTQSSSTAEDVIRALVETSIPLLEVARKAAKDREEDVGGGTLKHGTVIQVNTNNRTAIFTDEFDGDGYDPYSTVHFNPSKGGSASNTGSVIIKD